MVISTPISSSELTDLANKRFGDMVKGVVDIETGTLALGGELHADEEAVLLENGSLQENLWGINVFVQETFPGNIEFDSIINIRPSQNNRSRYVEDPEIRQRILSVLQSLIP